MLGRRFVELFLDPPSLAEFGAAVAVASYGASFFLPGAPEVEDWRSLGGISELLLKAGLSPDLWPGLTLLMAAGQITALLLGWRFGRAAAAVGMILWAVLMCRLVWPIYPYSPLLMMTTAHVVLVNVVLVARHARDWK